MCEANARGCHYQICKHRQTWVITTLCILDHCLRFMSIRRNSLTSFPAAPLNAKHEPVAHTNIRWPDNDTTKKTAIIINALFFFTWCCSLCFVRVSPPQRGRRLAQDGRCQLTTKDPCQSPQSCNQSKKQLNAKTHPREMIKKRTKGRNSGYTKQSVFISTRMCICIYV